MRYPTIAITGLLALAGYFLSVGTASAALVDATGYRSCYVGDATVTTGDISAGAENAVDCFGLVDGNTQNDTVKFFDAEENPYTQGTPYDYDFIAKYDVCPADATTCTPGELVLTGTDIGFDYDGAGNWTFSSPVTFEGAWMFVIKQASCWAGWTFIGGTYSAGTYEANWTGGTGDYPDNGSSCELLDGPSYAVSHFAFYGQTGEETRVPEPGTLALLGAGLIGFGLARRRRAA